VHNRAKSQYNLKKIIKKQANNNDFLTHYKSRRSQHKVGKALQSSSPIRNSKHIPHEYKKYNNSELTGSNFRNALSSWKPSAGLANEKKLAKSTSKKEVNILNPSKLNFGNVYQFLEI